MRDFLVEPLLEEQDIAHGFGLRGSTGPGSVCRALQVHGAVIADADALAHDALGEADGVVSSAPGTVVAIVTADCVPVLLADAASGAVAAVHAGWRGLASGVVARGVEALLARGAEASGLRAAIGPYIGAECYEVDEPVLAGLRGRFAADCDRALTPTSPGHARVDLGALVAQDLRRAGLPEGAIGIAAVACTRCDAQRFHSHRRDGASAGRMLHWITARAGVAPLRDRG